MHVNKFIENFIRNNDDLIHRTPLVWVERIAAKTIDEEIVEFSEPFPVSIHFEERGGTFNQPIIDLEKADDLCGQFGTDSVDWPNSQVYIHHGFIFDVRLIPNEFNGVQVIGITHGDNPKEFPDDNCMMYFHEFFSPANYERFVDVHFQKIAKTLKMETPTRSDLLDALTGNFNEYKKKCDRERNDILEAQKEELAFFHDLLKKTEEAYKNSEVRRHNWGYSVTATQIMKGKPLIVGFNWGVSAGYEHGPQKEYPLRVFAGNYDDLGSFKRVTRYFEEHFPNALSGMQTNFCFFRSEKEDQISPDDLERSRPLFEEYLHFSKPSVVLSFSSTLRDYLIHSGQLADVKTLFVNGTRGKLQIVKGFYLTQTGGRTPFVYLPHPNARLASVERNRAWQFCFDQQDS